MSDYHYGYIIEEFRKKRKVTQAALAQDWPKADGTKGVDEGIPETCFSSRLSPYDSPRIPTSRAARKTVF